VFTSGELFPDALWQPRSGVRLQEPVLLVKTDPPTSNRKELERLKPARIIILGGTGSRRQLPHRTTRCSVVG
jgi:hypothetical protein